MTDVSFHLVDVFTDRRFGGNQLAVFSDARAVPPDLMQPLARELNLSETTFVLPPQDAANTCQVRIFTPARELPMAGHPTVGTAFVLHRLGRLTAPGSARFEEGVGVIPVGLHGDDTDLTITMKQPLPTFGAVIDQRAEIAAMLSLTEADLLDGCPLQVVSTGVPFLYVPLKSLDAIQRIRVRTDLWEATTHRYDLPPEVFVFTLETELPTSTVHSRMFAPELGITEDPATGAASGPLGAYLVAHGLVDADRAAHMVSEQGFEMGRPSLIQIEIGQTDGQIDRVVIGGRCVYVGGGTISLA